MQERNVKNKITEKNKKIIKNVVKMKPEESSKQKNQGELFRNRLDQTLNHRHLLYQISKKINWEKFEKEFGKYYAEKTGRPGLRIRLLVT